MNGKESLENKVQGHLEGNVWNDELSSENFFDELLSNFKAFDDASLPKIDETL